MEKIIQLTPLAEIGQGSAKINNDYVEIQTSGINGSLKAWLIGGEAEAIGNIVDGSLKRRIDTRAHSGILITQSGRQMLIGRYREEKGITEALEKLPFESMGFEWKKVTERRFDALREELRFLLSNKNVYKNYKKYGHYWVGENERGSALAVVCGENDVKPFEFGIRKDGYAVVCVDKETKRLYTPSGA